jgi:hypothetical protein
VLSAPVTFFDPRPATAFRVRNLGGLWGQRTFSALNPPFGACFNYFLREHTGDEVRFTVADSTGKAVRKLTGSGGPGLHRVVWDLQGEPGDRIGRPEWNDAPSFVAAGRYTVTLTYGDRPAIRRTVEVRLQPGAEALAE